jgi:hypothetical protein
MDDINWRPTPDDPRIDPAAPPQKNGKPRNRETEASKPTSLETGTGRTVCIASLIKKDGLFVCIVRHNTLDAPADSPVDTRGLQAAEATLRQAITAVWDRVPWRDRHNILAYWQDPNGAVLFKDRRLPIHRPLIRILDVGLSSSPDPTCSKLGHVLDFPLLYLREQPESLTLDIARLFVQVQRYVNRQHYQLVLAKIEEPFAAWECQQLSEVSEVERDQKFRALEAQFLQDHEAAMNEGLRRWGFAKDERQIAGK